MSGQTDLQLVGDHGGQGSSEKNFTRLLKKDTDYKPLVLSNPDEALSAVASQLGQGDDDPSDKPDDQENPFVPAGYTYLGQFIDHDLTFDTRSTLQTLPAGLSSFPNDERTPRLDLDCLYGLGPQSSAFMYDQDGRLLTNPAQPRDLPRAASPFTPNDPFSHRAIIGDPRNDENSIVCQLQLAFIHFHNTVVDVLKGQGLGGPDLFIEARREVTRTYQKIIVTDFLKRIVRASVYDEFKQKHAAHGAGAYALYKPGHSRNALPLEFTGAAYRFGHSGVRNSYRLNKDTNKKIFDGTNESGQSLVGFGDLPSTHFIDWNLFARQMPAPGVKADNPDGPADPARLQFAYKLDTTLVDPLLHLPPRIGGPIPSLAYRNLRRGYNFSLPSGQDLAKALGVLNHPPLRFGERLLTFSKMPGLAATDANALEKSTPLWLYILAEAQADLLNKTTGDFDTIVDGGFEKIHKTPDQGTQLGSVGGTIVLEVFFGILDDDPDSYFRFPKWKSLVKPGSDTITLWDMLRFIGEV